MEATSEPLLSVLVPIYNVERYLRECLESLAGQTFGDFEALLLNDGSTDGSASIAREFAEADARFKLVDKPNTGYGATLNQGLELARGSYIAFLESDDKLYPEALARLSTAAVAFDADLVRGTFSLWWSEEGRTEEQHPYDADLIGRPLDAREDRRLFLYKSAIWSGIYRRSMLQENDIRFLETPGASYQDTSFAFKTYAASARAVFIDDPIIFYRQDNEASSVRSRGKVYAVQGEFDEIDRWLSRREDSKHMQLLHASSVIARCNAYLWNVDRIAPEFRPEFMHTISLEFSRMDDAKRIPWEDIDRWHAINIRSIIKNPDSYLNLRQSTRAQTATSKALFALKLGGPAALRAALAERKQR